MRSEYNLDSFVSLLKYIGFIHINDMVGSGAQYDLTIGNHKYELVLFKDSFNQGYYAHIKCPADNKQRFEWKVINEETSKEYFKDIIRENKLKSLLYE